MAKQSFKFFTPRDKPKKRGPRQHKKNLNKKAKIKNLKLQKGDVFKTHASMKNTWKLVKRKKTTNIKVGIQKFVEWYKKYHDHKRI